MTDKDGLPHMLFRPSRRQIISGMAALGAITAAPVRSVLAQAPKRIPIPEGEFVPLPIWLPIKRPVEAIPVMICRRLGRNSMFGNPSLSVIASALLYL